MRTLRKFHPVLDSLEPDGLLAVSIIEGCSGVSEREELRKIEVVGRQVMTTTRRIDAFGAKRDRTRPGGEGTGSFGCQCVSPVIRCGMAEVTVRELRNDGGRVLDRVARGESLTVTRDGQPIAELRPLSRRPLPASALLGRWRRLAHVDPARLKADIDRSLDSSV